MVRIWRSIHAADGRLHRFDVRAQSASKTAGRAALGRRVFTKREAIVNFGAALFYLRAPALLHDRYRFRAYLAPHKTLRVEYKL